MTANPPLSDAEKLEFGANTYNSPTPAKLVIASYNIRYARGPYLISGGVLRKVGLLNKSARPQVVGRYLTNAVEAFSSGRLLPKVDVLAVQESDKRTVRTGGHHVAEELAAELEMNWIHAPAGIPRGIKPVTRQWWLDFEEPIGLYDEGDTGVALLSRFPMRDVTRIDLPWQECPWRPRLAMAATINVGDRQFRIFNAHVDPHAAADGQLAQLEVIVKEAKTSTLPTLILGDFNTLSKNKCIETRRFLEANGYETVFPTGTTTWRGAGLRMHADWVFTRDVVVERWGVAKPLNVSDHWPIWVEIALD
ncbi:MAG TPA: endonuclease/exonuclease/phosphatase family protein [Pyrinomonadaceae bacterium]